MVADPGNLPCMEFQFNMAGACGLSPLLPIIKSCVTVGAILHAMHAWQWNSKHGHQAESELVSSLCGEAEGQGLHIVYE